MIADMQPTQGPAAVHRAAGPVMATGVWLQVHRYRRVEDPVRRQQIKWAVLGIVTGALVFLAWQSAFLVFGARTDILSRFVMVAARVVSNACQMAIPICFTIAILRYTRGRGSAGPGTATTATPRRSAPLRLPL
jgi:hypothetical protein